ncbi:hypothetical protein F0L74_13785 [Chitinophaga agrisoli]|uniref:VWA domain containing CoxE-like protein n=1 Tax=Chitinophaga agrisoli TaxID=2607653 RepID=A0A5B2VY44_9BACT|nr:hypothetical protein [Chitinophaga agrisoli]KAA2243558.1 hypothetical protein F0L74_13785 [Chitinophaga agrisoli]
MKNNHLLFWHFFQVIDRTLSYERGIDKYRLFLQTLERGYIPYDEELRAFKQFCRILYLQDIRDEARFNQLLDLAVEKEQNLLKQALIAARPVQKPAAAPRDSQLPGPPAPPEEEDEEAPPPAPDIDDDLMDDLLKEEGAAPPEPKTWYYKTPLLYNGIEAVHDEKRFAATTFLHTDEYFSITRRTMVKGWQFLRNKENSVSTQEIDVPATTFKIAQEGLFLEPVYRPGVRNREDALIILADVRGSMTPFHELTNRLIYTARHEGGHPRAPVYYFQNCPLGYVYRKPNLAEPVKIKEALVKANRNVTIAIVISDAGAARGNTNPTRVAERSQQTKHFLDFLYSNCAHVIWLNPVPKHRWAQTAADSIQNEVLQMASVFEQEVYNFQDTLRTIFKQNM